MKVIIIFKIDQETLELSIKNNLYYRKKITKKSLIETIKNEIYQKGMSLIYFPENWGDDICDIEDDLVTPYLEKYKDLISL